MELKDIRQSAQPSFFDALGNIKGIQMITPSLGFKVNDEYTTGVDWYANNRMDLNPNANITTGLTGTNNPGSDFVNQYGDESPNRRTLTLNGKQYVVSRTGYAEKDIANYDLQNF